MNLMMCELDEWQHVQLGSILMVIFTLLECIAVAARVNGFDSSEKEKEASKYNHNIENMMIYHRSMTSETIFLTTLITSFIFENDDITRDLACVGIGRAPTHNICDQTSINNKNSNNIALRFFHSLILLIV